MQKKRVKILLYALFSVMLIAAGYVIFFSSHMISDRRYFVLTAVSFVLVAIAFAVIVITGKTEQKKRAKLMVIICVALVAFQLFTLPAVNLFSQTLPAWPPRGTIYQFPGNSNSITQNEVGLMMRYYLDGKTLYADKNYPIEPQSHNGFLFITDEYDFVKKDYPVLSEAEGEKFHLDYGKTLYTVNVQANPKLKIPSFKIALSTDTGANELVLITDENNNWYFITPDIYGEAFGE